LSTVLIEPNENINKDVLLQAFEKANIESRPLWKPMHLQPLFCNYPYYGNKVSEDLFNKGLCLPSGTNLDNSEKTRIKDVVNKLFKE
jgi:dTDP-4-amino-4,6-dideoxygalactose transaminase